MVQPTTFFGLRAMRSTISEHHALNSADFKAEAVVDDGSGGRSEHVGEEVSAERVGLVV